MSLTKTLRATAPHYQCSKLLHQAADLIEQQQQEIEELELQVRSISLSRQELAAHVERLENEITGIIEDSVGVAGYHMNGDIASWQEFDIENILEQSPATSLADIKANAIEDAITSCKSKERYALPLVDTTELYEYASQLRQPAKGGE